MLTILQFIPLKLNFDVIVNEIPEGLDFKLLDSLGATISLGWQRKMSNFQIFSNLQKI
jgi:hypothetical protein